MGIYRLARHLKNVFLLNLLATFGLVGCMSSPATDVGVTKEIVRTCTLVNCSDTLSLNLVDAIPSDYTLAVIAPDGTNEQVHCVDGITRPDTQAESAHEPKCRPWGVSFTDFAPDSVTITLKWNGNEVTMMLEPEYELHWPNGPDCEPECRIGAAILNVPENP